MPTNREQKFPEFSLKEKVKLFGKSPEAVTNPTEEDDEETFYKKFGRTITDEDTARLKAASDERKASAKPPPAAPTPPIPSTSSTPAPSQGAANEVPSRTVDNELKRLEGRLDKYQEEAGKLDPETRKQFEARIEAAKSMFQAEDDNLAKQELVEKLSQAVVQLGAGLMGMKTGTDLSGLKFSLTDWDKKYQRSLDKYKLALDKAKEERQIANQEDQFKLEQRDRAVDRLSRAVQYRRGEERARDQLNEMIRHNKAMEGVALDKAAKGDPKAASRLQQRIDRVTKGVVDVYRNDKLDDDEKSSMAATLMSNAGLNISPEEAKEALTKPGFMGWWTTNKDPDEAMEAFSALIKNKAYTNFLQDGQDGVVANNQAPAPAASSTVERVTKDGRTAIFDARTKQFLKYKD